jgi:subtilisin family serine protease
MRTKLCKGALCLLLTSATALGFMVSHVAALSHSFAPNDPAFSQFHSTYQQIGAPEAWQANLPCSSVKVAVLDTGVTENADLKGLVVAQHNFVDGSNNAADDNGHGTKVASIIASRLNDNFGVPGLCPGAQLIVGKVSDSSNNTTSNRIIQGINWAVDSSAGVINLSVAESPGYPVDPTMKAAIQRAVSRGVVVVMGAGNNGSSDPSSNNWASESPEAIRVAGVDVSNAIYPASNHGSWVDIAALYSFPVDNLTGIWGTAGGTSFAVPQAAAAAAQLLAFSPGLTPDQAKQKLMSSGTKVPGLDVGCSCVLNLNSALLATGYKPATTTSTAQTTLTAPAETARLTLSVKGGGSARVGSSAKCSHVCTLRLQDGARLTASAYPKHGWRFGSWSGLCKGVKPRCSLKVKTGRLGVRFIKK